MKKTLFLPLLFILLALSGWAQESQQAPLPAQELLRLNLKADEDKCGGACVGSVKEEAKTFAILKVTPSPSGGIVPESLYLEKHQWEEEDKFKPYGATKKGAAYLISYPYSSGTLTITYNVGAFDPETKTQTLTIKSIEGLRSFNENDETKQKFFYRWQIKQKEDGSLELWETKPEFKLKNLVLGIAADWAGTKRGATYLERQGEKEIEAKDGTKEIQSIQQRDLVLKAKNEKSFPCDYNPLSELKNLEDFAHSVTSSMGGFI